MAAPLVSVITATRNRTDLLERALRSIAAQDFTDYEAIVVDDGSDPDVQQYHDAMFSRLPGQFRRHRNRPPGSAGAGPGAARNAGLKLATGEFVAFLDDDDEWVRTDHLSVGVEQLRRHGADFFFANMRGVRGGTILFPDWYRGTRYLTVGSVLNENPRVHDLPHRVMLRAMRSYYSHPNVWVVRRELVASLGGFWDKVRFGEDWELMMRVSERAARIIYRPDVVCAYRLPEGNSVSLSVTPLEEHIQMITCSIYTRLHCTCPASWRLARAGEAWHQRKLALALLAAGQPRAAASFAWQGLCTFPTVGGLALFARTLGRAIGNLSGLARAPVASPASASRTPLDRS